MPLRHAVELVGDGVEVPAGDADHIRPQQTLVLHERFRSGAAVLVERSLGLRSLEELTPQSVGQPAPWLRAQYSDAEGRMWKELDVAGLLQDPTFLEVSV